MKFYRFSFITGLALLISIAPLPRVFAGEPHGPARIFVLMVWDGLRPDLVTERDTPNLVALAREGVRFERHHSSYPTVTMVNAAVLATGADPATDGVIGNMMYFAPFVHPGDQGVGSQVSRIVEKPVYLEDSKTMAALNGRDGLDGHLVEPETDAQEVERQGGYVAIVGKKGPTFLFDDLVGGAERRVAGDGARGHLLFASDDLGEPESVVGKVAQAVTSLLSGVAAPSWRDAHFAQLVTEKALPEAKAAAQAGKLALVVFWQRNPDATQHLAGLGTAAASEALRTSDDNLGRIRAAIRGLGIEQATDLMVVSDHGFATIRMRVKLGELLIGMGLKKSAESTDVVVARNGGSDLIYLSPTEFASRSARREILDRIVRFAAAQEWCGPIFSREPSPEPGKPYLGWIDGTFSQETVGLLNSTRSPDLIISFRELSDIDNSSLTGPGNPAFAIGGHGQQSEYNRSQALIRAVKGVTYADTSTRGGFGPTTGMGIHGAAGRRELRNFCAAVGPDFRKRFSDNNATGNIDVAPTIEWLLGLTPDGVAAGSSEHRGRILREALIGAGGAGASRSSSISTSLELQGMMVKVVLHFVGAGGRNYLDDATVEHIKLGQSP
jgi:hypothetical protein